jgi:hypothetical protein
MFCNDYISRYIYKDQKITTTYCYRGKKKKGFLHIPFAIDIFVAISVIYSHFWFIVPREIWQPWCEAVVYVHICKKEFRFRLLVLPNMVARW